MDSEYPCSLEWARFRLVILGHNYLFLVIVLETSLAALVALRQKVGVVSVKGLSV